MPLKRRRILKIVSWTLGVFILLMLVLAAHIYIVSQPPKNLIDWKLSRIDFNKAPLDSLTAVRAQEIIKKIPEVLDSRLNIKDGTLVYKTLHMSNKHQYVFDEFVRQGGGDAHLFKPDVSEGASKGCPAIIKETAPSQLYALIKDFF